VEHVEVDLEERRASTRSRTILEGHIRFLDGRQHLGCTVMDLSDTGARILLDGDAVLPAAFELRVPKRKLACRVRVIWSHGRNRGLAFVADEEDAVTLHGQDADDVVGIVEEARVRIAARLGMSVDKIRLGLEIDG